jgi:thiamine-monophosphate kinase
MVLNEFELIARLRPLLPETKEVVLGAGDDCAVLDLGLPDRWLLYKTDAIVEQVHFTRETPPAKIGRKALARCLSDIAAMGGKPSAALITLGLPADFDPLMVEECYRGLREIALQAGVAIVGGETVRNPGGVLISVALLGTVQKERVARRSGGQVGDAVFVTGELGGSIAGKHLEFEPRLAEGRWLAEQMHVHSMIDLSDGLAGDLRHILEASGVGAELLAGSIPISREAKLRARESGAGKPALLAALTDGEDFELLFTLPSGRAVTLLDGWKAEFPSLKLTCIGKLQKEPGLRLRTADGIRTLGVHGYTHFA